MDDALLRGDCARCAGLCCVALAFDHSELFGFDKPAGEPCLYLADDHRCRIHRERGQRGFAGCARYDCLGAGQRVTQELFGGASWRQRPGLLRPMLEAFRQMRQVHGWLLLLREAGRLPLDAGQTRQRDELLEVLQPAGGWSVDKLSASERGSTGNEVKSFLVGLRDCVASQGRAAPGRDGAEARRQRADEVA